MSLSFAVETGTGLSLSAEPYVSYLSLEEAGNINSMYIYANIHDTRWDSTEFTDDDRIRALLFASEMIDKRFEFVGEKKSRTQALQFPRSYTVGDSSQYDRLRRTYGTDLSVVMNNVPMSVKKATAEMARLSLRSHLVDEAAVAISAFQNDSLSVTSSGQICPIVPKIIEIILSDFLANTGIIVHLDQG